MVDASPIFDPSNPAAFALYMQGLGQQGIAAQQAAAGAPVTTYNPLAAATSTTSSSAPPATRTPAPIPSFWDTLSAAFSGTPAGAPAPRPATTSTGSSLAKNLGSMNLAGQAAKIGQPLLEDESLTGRGGSGDGILDQLAKFVPALTAFAPQPRVAQQAAGPDVTTIAIVGGVVLLVVLLMAML